MDYKSNNFEIEDKIIQEFNMEVVTSFLKENGVLSFICIDASSLKNIELEYGKNVYSKISNLLTQYLIDFEINKDKMYGCFRYLFKKSQYEEIYFILFDRTKSSYFSETGSLEKFCDFITIEIQNYVRDRLNEINEECEIKNIPYVSTGYSESLYNPCLNSIEVVEKHLKQAEKQSVIQTSRLKSLQKEFLNTIIFNDGLLTPHYQAVFDLNGMNESLLEEVQHKESIAPVSDLIYGFEALIRINPTLVSSIIDIKKCVVHPKFLNPELLFFIAKKVNMACELDQLCIKKVCEKGMNLPGRMMINILPRNLYGIHLLNDYYNELYSGIFSLYNNKIVFEVSETEAINNFNLMKEVRQKLMNSSIQIATDDFGNGFAGLERVIQIQPNIIKLDRSLVVDIHLSALKQAYVEGIINVAKLASIKILAEGIEVWEEAKVLKDMGVDYVQGYLFHKPQSFEEISEQLVSVKDTIEEVAS